MRNDHSFDHSKPESDPFEEFEFKPLTEGLGFHQQRENSPSQPQRDAGAPQPRLPATITANETPLTKATNRDLEMQLMAPDAPLLRSDRPTIQAPLPRQSPKPAATPAPGALNKVDEILKTLSEHRKFDFIEPRAVPNKIWADSRPELSALTLDGMLIFASYLAALIVLLMITRVDLFGNLMNPDEDGMIYFALAGLLASIVFVYSTVSRIFLGFTPGEWVFDQRLGLPEQMNTVRYSLLVAARGLLNIATGLIVLPLLSIALRRDVAGRLLGLQIVKKVS